MVRHGTRTGRFSQHTHVQRVVMVCKRAGREGQPFGRAVVDQDQEHEVGLTRLVDQREDATLCEILPDTKLRRWMVVDQGTRSNAARSTSGGVFNRVEGRHVHRLPAANSKGSVDLGGTPVCALAALEDSIVTSSIAMM